MPVIVSKIVPRGYRAMAIWPFIFFREEKWKHNKRIINHEKIHHAQQKEMLLVFFYLWYVIEYVFHATKGAGAYRKIRFEKEAYANESDTEYLKKRKLFNWLNY